MDNYSIRPIATNYKHRLYRSRLEARWAAFFDLAEWKTEYEPLDLAGWSPDFLINECARILVEIKPQSSYFEEDSFYFDYVLAEMCDAILLLTNEIEPYTGAWAKQEDELYSIGKLITREFKQEILVSPAIVGVFWGSSYRLGLCSESSHWKDLVTGLEGECFVIDNGEVPFMWREAANRSMFLKPSQNLE